MRWRSTSAAESPGARGGPRAGEPPPGRRRRAGPGGTAVSRPLGPRVQVWGERGTHRDGSRWQSGAARRSPAPDRNWAVHNEGLGFFFDVLQSKTKIFRLPRPKLSCALLLGERSPLWVNLRRRKRLRYRPGREGKGGKAPRHAGGAGRGERGNAEPPTTPRLQADAQPSPKSAPATCGEGECHPCLCPPRRSGPARRGAAGPAVPSIPSPGPGSAPGHARGQRRGSPRLHLQV